MAPANVVVVGASMGGLEALRDVVSSLPANLKCSIFVTLHVGPRSVLATILSRMGSMSVSEAVHGESIRPAHIYVAPPNHHLMLEPETLRVEYGPRENGHRPSIDPLFRSAARAFDSRVIGVLLSGALDDGVAGLGIIKESGGVTVVQNPAEALNPSMPESALRQVAVDYCLRAAEIGPLLARLCANGKGAPMSNARKPQNAAPKAPNSAAAPPTPNTAPREKVSPFTCPECNGTLWEVHDKQLLSFRCRVGHAYSEENMEAAQATSVERALWAALRALEERAALERGLAEKAREQARSFTARRFEERAAASECNAEQIRAILHKPFDGEEEQPSEPGE